MRPFPIDEEAGIAGAQQALDDLRTILRKKPRAGADDKQYALQYQLENLEDMLRVITDRRYARSLADSSSLPWNAGEPTLDTLQLIISTARSAMWSTVEASPSGPRQNVLIGRTTKALVAKKAGSSAMGSSLSPGLRQPVNPPIGTFLTRRTALRQARSASDPVFLTGRNTAPHKIEQPTPIIVEIATTSARDKGKTKLRVTNGNPLSPTETRQSGMLVYKTLPQAPKFVRRDTKIHGDDAFDESVDLLISSNPHKQIQDQDNEEQCRGPEHHQSILSPQSSSKLTSVDETVEKRGSADKFPNEISEPTFTSSAAKRVDELFAALEPFPTPEAPAESSTGINRRPQIIEDTESVPDDWVSEPWLSRSSLNASIRAAPSLRPTHSSTEQDALSSRTSLDTQSFDALPWNIRDSLTGLPVLEDHWPRAEGSQPHRGTNTRRSLLIRSSLPSFRASLRRTTPTQFPVMTSGRAEDSGLVSRTWKDTCAACYDTLYHITTRLAAPCGHAYCQECGINLIKTYTSQESLHPLRCCNIPIPNELVRPILSPAQYNDLLQKEREFNTPIERRIYCPNTGCRQFIKVGKIASYLFLRDKMKCPACSSWICIRCKEFMHPGNKCGEENENVIRFEALVKEKGWQRCGKCHRVVERTYGCLHMTCLCGYEFCYRCGAGTSTKCGHGVFGNNDP